LKDENIIFQELVRSSDMHHMGSKVIINVYKTQIKK